MHSSVELMHDPFDDSDIRPGSPLCAHDQVREMEFKAAMLSLGYFVELLGTTQLEGHLGFQ